MNNSQLFRVRMQTGWKSSPRGRGISVLIRVKKLTLFLCYIYKCFVLYSQWIGTYFITPFHFSIFHTASFFEAHPHLPHGVPDYFGASSSSQTAFWQPDLRQNSNWTQQAFWQPDFGQNLNSTQQAFLRLTPHGVGDYLEPPQTARWLRTWAKFKLNTASSFRKLS